MKCVIATLQLCLIFLICGCAHTYNAPDPTKVKAKTAIVEADQKKAHKLNAEIKSAFKTSQERADAIVVVSGKIENKIDEIIKVAPPELQPALALVKEDLKTQRTHEDALIAALGLGYTKQGELENHLILTDSHVAELKVAQVNLFAGGELLAQQATKESADRARYQRKSWGLALSITGIGVAIVLVIIFWKVILAAIRNFKFGL